MSIIVHGPQGCGKTLAASLLKRAFRLDVTWDDGDYVDLVPRVLYAKQPLGDTQSKRLPSISPGALYPWVRKHGADLKSARILFITCEQPPQDLQNSRRVVPFEDALQLAVNIGIRTYLADWPRAQSIRAITARALLDAIGVPLPLQTKPLFNTVNRVMSELRWNRVRLREPGEPVSWAYRPTTSREAANV